MDIIMVSSEAYPFAKSGGMGDVVGALTKYLPNNDFSIKLFLPAYSSLLSEFQFNPEQDITFSFGESMVKASYLTFTASSTASTASFCINNFLPTKQAFFKASEISGISST
jgi:glycogen synthase